MIEAVKACHGVWHCKSLSAFDSQDAVVLGAIIMLLLLISWLVRR